MNETPLHAASQIPSGPPSDKLPSPSRATSAWEDPLWEDWELDDDDDPPFDTEFGDLTDGSK